MARTKLEAIGSDEVQVGDMIHGNAAGNAVEVLNIKSTGKGAGSWYVRRHDGTVVALAFTAFTTVVKETTK